MQPDSDRADFTVNMNYQLFVFQENKHYQMNCINVKEGSCLSSFAQDRKLSILVKSIIK